jgi:hypothetical protein
MLERPCEVAHLRVVEEEVGADAVDFTTEGVKGISNARISRGCPCRLVSTPSHLSFLLQHGRCCGCFLQRGHMLVMFGQMSLVHLCKCLV